MRQALGMITPEEGYLRPTQGKRQWIILSAADRELCHFDPAFADDLIVASAVVDQ